VNLCPDCRQPITTADAVCDHCAGLAGEPAASFVAPPTVARTPVPPAGWLVVVRGAELNVGYPLRPGANLLGRSGADVDLSEQEPPDMALASRRHAVLRVSGDDVTVEDLGSRNGTVVNRTKLTPREPVPFRPGDVLQIGTIQFQFQFEL
jgi:hypothetical protein